MRRVPAVVVGRLVVDRRCLVVEVDAESLPEHVAGIDALARCAERLDLLSVFQMGLDPPA